MKTIKNKLILRSWVPKQRPKLSRFGIVLNSGSSSLLRNRFNYKLKKNAKTTPITTTKPKLGFNFKSSSTSPQSPCSASMKCIESNIFTQFSKSASIAPRFYISDSFAILLAIGMFISTISIQ